MVATRARERRQRRCVLGRHGGGARQGKDGGMGGAGARVEAWTESSEWAVEGQNGQDTIFRSAIFFCT
jgi:hypothetical protein